MQQFKNIMESRSNAERFLSAFAQIESKMQKLANETRYVPFSQLLARLSTHNRIIANNQEALREYSELRNAIVHMRGDNQEIIAEPCASVTENIERIVRLLSVDDSILNYACHPVKCVKKEDSLEKAFSIMEKMDSSKIPVYEGNQYVGLLTSSMIAKYALRHHESGCVKDALIRKENERVLFLSKSSNIQMAVRGFERALKEGNALLAVIITEHGKAHELPIGIITYADFPTIMKG